MRRLLALALAFLGVGVVTARADTLPVSYTVGWNMAGGPAGTDLSSAEALYEYANGSYRSPAGGTTSACAGYWAYYPQSTEVTLAASTATSQTCSLQTGWTMLGDPFDVPAMLPPGVVGYRWNPQMSKYEEDPGIRAGGALWIWSPSGGSIDLTAVPNGSVTIAAPPPPQNTVELQTGEYFTILVPLSGSGPAFTATASGTYLHPVSSGPAGPLAEEPAYYYRWQAATAGSTTIDLSPACRAQGCAAPDFVVRVEILAS